MKEKILSFLNSIYLFFKEFYLRLKASSPAYMVKIRTICLTLAGIGGSLATAGVNFAVLGFDIPKLVAVLGAVASVIASLPVSDPDALNQQIQGASNSVSEPAPTITPSIPAVPPTTGSTVS